MTPELPQPNQPLPTPPIDPKRWLPWVAIAALLLIIGSAAGAISLSGSVKKEAEPTQSPPDISPVTLTSPAPITLFSPAPAAEVTTPSPAPTPPSGFVTYSHDDPAFTLIYPKAWGAVEEQKLPASNKETDQWLDFSQIDSMTNLKITTYRPERTIRDLTAPRGGIGESPTVAMSAEKNRIAQQPDTHVAGQPVIVHEDVFIPGGTIGRTYVFYSATHRFELTGRYDIGALYAKEWTGDTSLGEVVEADMGQDFFNNPRPIAALLKKHPEAQQVKNFFATLQVVVESVKL